jgi:hypothetical protein
VYIAIVYTLNGRGIKLKKLGRKNKIVLLVLVVVSIVTITPILGTQLHRIVKRNSLQHAYYTIESIECTDGFGYTTTFMVKSPFNTNYQVFPEEIVPWEYNTYYDNESNYICYGVGKQQDSVYTFTFDLDLKVKQDTESQKIRLTITLNDHKGSISIWFGRLGGELLITFRVIAIQRC